MKGEGRAEFQSRAKWTQETVAGREGKKTQTLTPGTPGMWNPHRKDESP